MRQRHKISPEKTDQALHIFDYMLSSMHAIYRDSGSTMGEIKDPFYMLNKLRNISETLDRDFNGSFKEFHEAMENLDWDIATDYELTG